MPGSCDCPIPEKKGKSGTEPLAAATVLTASRGNATTQKGTLLFRPFEVQKGTGPHLYPFTYITDELWDTRPSDAEITNEGIQVSETEGIARFGINACWNVEGFGYTFMTADRGGEFYALPDPGDEVVYNLNYELARSRVARNRVRKEKFRREGWSPSREVEAYHDLSENLLEDASKKSRLSETCAELAQQSLHYAMWAGEMMEIDAAKSRIQAMGYREDFAVGCDAKSFYQLPNDIFLERFPPLFDYATITHVVNGDPVMGIFEESEGDLNFDLREILLRRLTAKDITVEGRALFWFHKWVIPDWLREKSYDELRKYVETHTREVLGFYGDRMYAWEIVNEMHDWANAVRLTPEQAVEITRLACDVAKDVAPNVKRVVNNCCPFAEYVHMEEWSGGEAKYPQRTPWLFTRDLIDAGVDFDIIGQQMYYPGRDLQDITIMIERYEELSKPVHISEIGVTSGVSEIDVKTGEQEIPQGPYGWHRQWDEELQADWLEGIYQLAYSLPFVKAANWFDFIDPFAYIENGGLLKDLDGTKKASYYRLERLKKRWKSMQTKE